LYKHELTETPSNIKTHTEAFVYTNISIKVSEPPTRWWRSGLVYCSQNLHTIGQDEIITCDLTSVTDGVQHTKAFKHLFLLHFPPEVST